VWAVVPGKLERRSGPGLVTDEERRKHSESRVRLGADFAGGWLCFATKLEKRRLAPFPSDWDAMSNEALCKLCEQARVARAPRRLAD
jgi:hypothetical protein